MPVVLIHKNPHLMDACCDLINLEWPRSKTARMRTLQMSCDTLPSCLVLVQENKVIGHSKISPLPGHPSACFVESVVVHPEYRGKGLGRELMDETERFAKSLGMGCMYLTTIDKEEFYKKLGYSECPAVPIFGCPTVMIPKPNSRFSSSKSFSTPPSSVSYPPPPPPPPLPIPPPPPPPPPKSLHVPSVSMKAQRKTFMKKCL